MATFPGNTLIAEGNQRIMAGKTAKSARPAFEGAGAAMAVFGRAVLDLLWPPQCLVSREIVGATGQIAPDFWKQLAFIDAPLCARCGLPFAYDPGPDALCPTCIAYPPAFDRARAPLAYGSATSKMLIQFKWGGRMDGVKPFAAWMARAAGPSFREADIVVPVPLHVTRLVSRRFNQSALLAQQLARILDVELSVDLLVRTRRTPSQMGKNRKQRRSNVAKAFAVRPARRAAAVDRHVLLVDDVLTTGATVNACAKALKQAGARQVDVVTLARVVDDEWHSL